MVNLTPCHGNLPRVAIDINLRSDRITEFTVSSFALWLTLERSVCVIPDRPSKNVGSWYARGPSVVPCVPLAFEINLALLINNPGLLWNYERV